MVSLNFLSLSVARSPSSHNLASPSGNLTETQQSSPLLQAKFADHLAMHPMYHTQYPLASRHHNRNQGCLLTLIRYPTPHQRRSYGGNSGRLALSSNIFPSISNIVFSVFSHKMSSSLVLLQKTVWGAGMRKVLMNHVTVADS